ncbi:MULTISPECIES: HD domain-containing protein [Cyanophyceae]|uniref:HD domain-containing protein n=1 Tax=Cyanophyceae TaxID=3028117 RepID=UPI001687BF80|nr:MULTISPECIES: HD domain-containing protein [Cyanophyceae]MBD1916841.1 HD domain-containing protein [Phormidium sp. FACHB-77]MBD2029472.1 HD domain-containing protein [Phormidium sp. FACHB-322]MBD2052048.1 HD domain-containing protein [Leptolyngbya sp. FACHB-60]
MTSQRLQQQIAFVVEIDRLKQVLRQTQLMDASRRENSAEHSWHLAMMALVLAEYAPAEVDMQRAIHQVLVHDLVEIDAGDTFCYDAAGHDDKGEREQRAADRIFGLLPEAIAQDLRQLWDEFEAQASPTARFAASLDRIQPLLHNWQTGGGTWRQHGICQAQVMQRMAPVEKGAPELWPFVLEVIEESVAKGYLKP